MIKALVTGGSQGFGAKLCQSLGEGSLGVSRQTGHDLWKSAERKRIVELSLNFDIFVNFAHVDFMQTKLLYEVGRAWENAGKAGHIFNIGSYATYCPPSRFQMWVVSKHSLDVANKQFCKKIEAGELPFKMTLIRLGLLDIERNRKRIEWPGQAHSPEEVAGLIKLAYTQNTSSLLFEITAHAAKLGEQKSTSI